MQKITRAAQSASSAKELPGAALAASRASNGQTRTSSAAPDEYLTVKEAARFLKCSKSFLDKLRCTGGGPPYTKLGNKVLYRRSDLETWMRQFRFESTSQYTQSLK